MAASEHQEQVAAHAAGMPAAYRVTYRMQVRCACRFKGGKVGERTVGAGRRGARCKSVGGCNPCNNRRLCGRVYMQPCTGQLVGRLCKLQRHRLCVVVAVLL